MCLDQDSLSEGERGGGERESRGAEDVVHLSFSCVFFGGSCCGGVCSQLFAQ